MSKYQIGDLVLIKDSSFVYEIDGVMTKSIAGKITTIYESKIIGHEPADDGAQRLLDDNILAKVIIQKPRAKRKSKQNIEPELPLGTSIETS